MYETSTEVLSIVYSATDTFTDALLFVKLVSWPVPFTETWFGITPNALILHVMFKVTVSPGANEPIVQIPVFWSYTVPEVDLIS